MKEFKEWCKDKVIAFTEGIYLHDGVICDWYKTNDCNWVVNDAKYQTFKKKQPVMLWMLKTEYDKLEFPKEHIGLWKEVPREYQMYCSMFNEKTKIR
jgi:hypothetical protein